jgi:Beta propeller domain
MRRLRREAGIRRGSVLAGASIRGCAYTLGWVACGGVFACGGLAAQDEQVARRHADLTAEVNDAALSSGLSCDALLDRSKGVLLAQVQERAEQARVVPVYLDGGVIFNDVLTVRSSRSVAPAPPAAAPSGSSEFSSTTGPVPGVERGDFVKAEGDRIYLLQGSELLVLDAASASALELVARVPVEGQPMELFVRDGKLVVISSFYGPLPELPVVYNPYYYSPGYTKFTLIDATGDTPSVVREAYFEGNSSFSERTGSVVRGVVQTYKGQLDYPNIRYVDFLGHPYSQAQIDLQVDLWVQLATQSIEDSTIDDYLATQYERAGGELERQPVRCADLLLPEVGPSESGSTTLVAIDLADLDVPFGNLTLLGSASVANLSEDTALLSQVNYAASAADPSVTSQLHLFHLEGTSATHVASGTLPAYLQSQPSLEAGVIRVVTARDLYGVSNESDGQVVYLGSTSQVVTLQAEQGRLEVLGETENLLPNGYINVASFTADRAYVLASDTANRLLVVDLSDPSSPTVAGQVELSGYGYVLVPLPHDQVLSLTQYSDPITYAQQLALQVFDASDPTAPRVASEYQYGDPFASEATYDTRAITFHPDQSLFALPVQSYMTGTSSIDVFQLSTEGGLSRLGGVAPGARELPLESCLALFGYPTDPASIEGLDPALLELLLQQCVSYSSAYLRRGLFRGNDVFSISTLAVAAHSLDALDGPPLSQVDLPDPYYSAPVPLVSVPTSEPPASP